MNPRASVGHPNLYHQQYYYETTRPPETSSYACPGTRMTRQRPQEATQSYEYDASCVVAAPGQYTTKKSAGNQVESPVDELRQQYAALSERVDELRELRKREGYGARMNEINVVRVEMAKVAGKLNSYLSSLPEYLPNKGRVQTLDALCVERVLTHSYPQESWNTSSGRVPSSYMLPPTARRRFTTSTTPVPPVDVSNRVHNMLDGSHQPRRQESMCFDDVGFDRIETTKDTSLRRVPPVLPSVDVLKHVHNVFDGSHKPTQREPTCFDEFDVDYIENFGGTSPRRVPSFLPSVDASNCVHNTSDGFHKPTSRFSTL
jgi:hypothetical protein